MGPGELASARRRDLRRWFRAGSRPDPEELTGWEYRGLIAGTIPRAVRFTRFVKGMRAGPRGPEGYNVFCSQRDWRRWGWRGRPLRHSWYDIRSTVWRGRGCVLLDYGSSPRNPRLLPTRLFRDLLVHPDPGEPGLVLGKAYLAVGIRIPLAFFVLERDRPIG